MSSGFMMTLNSHGIREGSKADRPDEAKVKAEEEEGSSDQGKEKAEERKKKRKGRSHMVSEEGYEEEWDEGDGWNDSYDGYWADDQNWNEGYWAYENLYYLDEYGYFQKKRKGKGKGIGKKGKKGKDDEGKGGNQEMEKDSPTMFNLRPHRLLPYRIINNNSSSNNNNKLTTLQQHQAQGMVSLQLQRLTQHMWMF